MSRRASVRQTRAIRTSQMEVEVSHALPSARMWPAHAPRSCLQGTLDIFLPPLSRGPPDCNWGRGTRGPSARAAAVRAGPWPTGWGWGLPGLRRGSAPGPGRGCRQLRDLKLVAHRRGGGSGPWWPRIPAPDYPGSDGRYRALSQGFRPQLSLGTRLAGPQDRGSRGPAPRHSPETQPRARTSPGTVSFSVERSGVPA